MRLQIKYLLFVSILHLLALVLSFYIFMGNRILFIISETIILFSMFLCWQLYNQLIQPLKLLMQGVDAIRDKDFNVKFVSTGKYEMDQLIRVYNQMIDALRAERTSQEQQHLFLKKLIYTSPTGILILDYDERFQQVNPKALELLGLEETDIVGKAVGELSHPVLKQVSSMNPGESKVLNLNGSNTYKLQKSHFIDHGFPRHFVMMEELTAEILAAEKKAYGKVIRMMAHEVNNTIGPVNSILQSALKSQIFLSESNGQVIQNALQVALERNYNLNHFMRNFADVVRLPTPARKEMDVQQTVKNMAELMERKAVEKEIQFGFDFAGDALFIYADAQQMEQVLINVIKNAMEAIEHTGTILFSTNQLPKRLIITDSGSGIPVPVTDHLFSPFFSTKKDGQGIGLTLVKEILINHGFEFSLKTVDTRRTEFMIEF